MSLLTAGPPLWHLTAVVLVGLGIIGLAYVLFRQAQDDVRFFNDETREEERQKEDRAP